MTPARLQESSSGFRRLRIAVIGDFFLDKYLDVDPSLAEVSLETGKTAHQVVGIRHSPGAAGTVVCNLAALGTGTLHAVGFTGDDGESYDLRNDLAALRCSTEHLYCDPRRSTPTYLKPRDKGDPSLAGEHNRYDTKNRSAHARRLAAADRPIARRAAAAVGRGDCPGPGGGAGLRGDYRRPWPRRWPTGPERHPKVVFWADSRRRIRQFRNVIIKPNQFEAVGVENPPPDAKVDWASWRRRCGVCGR